MKDLQIVEKHPELKNTNLEAATYNELARSFYYKNQFENALAYAEKGISCFDEKGERKYIKQNLYISKAIYLEKLDKLHESLKTLEDMWSEINSIKNIHVILNMYETRAMNLKKLHRGREAIVFCDEGIEIARINKVYERSFDLWTVRGSIFSELGDLEEAKECFLMALGLERHIEKKYLFANTYTELGRLYLKQHLFDEAIRYLNKAVALGEETNDARRLAQALLVLGDCYFVQDDHSEALPYYKKAYDMATNHHFKRLLKEILVQLVQSAKKTNDSNYKKYIDELVNIEVQLQHKEIL